MAASNIELRVSAQTGAFSQQTQFCGFAGPQPFLTGDRLIPSFDSHITLTVNAVQQHVCTTRCIDARRTTCHEVPSHGP